MIHTPGVGEKALVHGSSGAPQHVNVLKNGARIKEVLPLIQQRMIYTLQPSALLKNGACTNTSCLFVLMSLAKRLIYRDALQIQKTPDQRFNEDRRNHLYQPSSSKCCQHHLESTTGFPHASVPGVNTPIMSTLAACESALAEGNPPKESCPAGKEAYFCQQMC